MAVRKNGLSRLRVAVVFDVRITDYADRDFFLIWVGKLGLKKINYTKTFVDFTHQKGGRGRCNETALAGFSIISLAMHETWFVDQRLGTFVMGPGAFIGK